MMENTLRYSRRSAKQATMAVGVSASDTGRTWHFVETCGTNLVTAFVNEITV